MTTPPGAFARLGFVARISVMCTWWLLGLAIRHYAGGAVGAAALSCMLFLVAVILGIATIAEDAKK